MKQRRCVERSMAVGLVAAFLAIAPPIVFGAETTAQKNPAGFSWQKSDDSVALLSGGKVVWRHNHNKSEDRPYIHPLGTVDGDVLTWLRPADHRHHRAVWFAWKKINGLNYWEEDRRTGLSPGRSEITDVQVKTKNFSAQIEITLSYHPPDKPEIMSEKRLIAISAPDKTGRYTLDWTSIFTATGEDAVLDRTPIPGQPGGAGHGGYAGLSIRMAKQTRGWTFLSSEGLKGMALHGKNAKWVDASGKTPSGKEAGVAILDHPSNMRHPSPWYLAVGMPYYSPAVIFNEPFTLKKGRSFTLKYRVLVHPGPSDKQQLDRQWKAFSKK